MRHLKRLWPLVVVLVALNAVLILALALGNNDGGKLESGIRAAAEGEEGEEEEEGLGPAEPDDYFLFQRSSGGKLPSTADFTRAVRQAREVRAATAAAPGAETAWALEGPTNVGGRLTDLAIDPTDPDTVYVAAATGGVWKTTDGGVTLEQAWPDDAAQAVGAIAIGADGAIWAGTGELNPGGGSITFGGTGVYRSDDGGATWKRRCSMRAASAGSTAPRTAARRGGGCSRPRRRSPAAPTS